MCAFRWCSNLHSVIGLQHVSCSLERIGDGAFLCCGKLTTLELSRLTQLQYLGQRAFFHCRSLIVVDLSRSLLLDAITQNTFFECRALKIMHLPPNLKHIEAEAFGMCTALVSIAIPALVETMDFRMCSGLTRVTFQSTRRLRALTSQRQFHGCTSLHTFEFQGHHPIPRNLWPRLLELFFLRRRNSILARAGVDNGQQRVTMAWNFVRANIVNFYLEEKKKPSVGRKRDKPLNS